MLTHFHREDGLFGRSLDGSERRSRARPPCIMTDLFDRMGVPRNAGAKPGCDRSASARNRRLGSLDLQGTSCRKNGWESSTLSREETTFARTRGTPTRIDYTAAPAEMLARFNWKTAAADKEHAKARSLSCDPEQERAREEQVWSKGVGKSHP